MLCSFIETQISPFPHLIAKNEMIYKDTDGV